MPMTMSRQASTMHPSATEITSMWPRSCSTEMCAVHAEDAGMLARASMQAALSGKGRLQIVRRIAEATNAAKQAPTMRAKAVKALSGVVKSDTSLLALPDVQHSINGALKVCDKNMQDFLQLSIPQIQWPPSADSAHSHTHAS